MITSRRPLSFLILVHKPMSSQLNLPVRRGTNGDFVALEQLFPGDGANTAFLETSTRHEGVRRYLTRSAAEPAGGGGGGDGGWNVGGGRERARVLEGAGGGRLRERVPVQRVEVHAEGLSRSGSAGPRASRAVYSTDEESSPRSAAWYRQYFNRGIGGR